MEVTKANLATYLAGLAPSATPYQIEITETVASDWDVSAVIGTVGNIINTNTPSGVYLDLGLTVIPNSVTDMHDTFFYCTSLTTAPAIPNSVTNMDGTFYNCTSLTTAPVIPNSVIILNSAFSGCTSLSTAPIIPNSVTNMYSTFYNCTSLTTAPVIPNSVIILNSAFRGCTSLSTAPIIPNSVTNMYETFRGCTSLHTIQNFAVNVDNCIITKAFSNCPALANIYVTTLTESSWHLLHTNTGATGTDYTIYNPDGTIAGNGTVAGTSQVLTLYGKSDELVISANITPTLAEETATSQVQWHKSGLPYDDELMIFNAKNPTTVISNLLITTLRYSASFTLPTYLDGQKIRIANTHATNTITCTLPTGQTYRGAGTVAILPNRIIELELIGTTWLEPMAGELKSNSFVYTNLTITWHVGSADADSRAYLSGSLMEIQFSHGIVAQRINNWTKICTISGLPTNLTTGIYRFVIGIDTTSVRYSIRIDMIIMNGSTNADCYIFFNGGIGLTAGVDNVTGIWGETLLMLR